MTVIDQLFGRKILCVGDVMIDKFITGTVKRISPESPTPILSFEEERVELGGAGNVARNVIALGGFCTVIGVMGDDSNTKKLITSTLLQPQLSVKIITDPARPTTEKTRFIAQKHTMLRVDCENTNPISSKIENELIALIKEAIINHDALVLSDYSKGVLTDQILSEAILAANNAGIPIVVDPKSAKLSRYAGATVITPNVNEIALATGLAPNSDMEAEIVAEQAMHMASCQAILLTRSEKGMTLVTRDHPPVHVKATAHEVFDVVGAGDTVVATLSLCLASGISIFEGASIANIAAGIAVSKQGTAVVSPKELTDVLSSFSTKARRAEEKIFDSTTAGKVVKLWKNQGYKVGFTNGCFDILHAGHVHLLNFVKSNSERVIIGINSDASVKRLKGPARPINSAEDRALLLASLKNVDGVVIFDEDTPAEIIKELLPDVLVKGADYEIDRIVGADIVKENGGTVLRCDLVPGQSTTGILTRLVGMTNVSDSE